MEIMYKLNKLLVFALVIPILPGCRITKNMFFSYKVDSYTTDTTKHLLTSSRIISYGDYLFEFKLRTNIESVVYRDTDSATTSIDYDTIGVYLLGEKNEIYYEFDTFTINNKIVKTGRLFEKEFGHKYPVSDSIRFKADPIFYPVDTIINKINCFYVPIVSGNTGNSVEIKVILIKKRNLNSLYKIGGAKFPDKNYCIVGYNVYSFEKKEGFVQEINTLRPLTEKEQKICESMIIKSNAHIADAIKSETH